MKSPKLFLRNLTTAPFTKWYKRSVAAIEMDDFIGAETASNILKPATRSSSFRDKSSRRLVGIFVHHQGRAFGPASGRKSFWPMVGDERRVARQGMTSKSPFSFHADCPPFRWLRSQPGPPFLLLSASGGVASFGYTLLQNLLPTLASDAGVNRWPDRFASASLFVTLRFLSIK